MYLLYSLIALNKMAGTRYKDRNGRWLCDIYVTGSPYHQIV